MALYKVVVKSVSTDTGYMEASGVEDIKEYFGSEPTELDLSWAQYSRDNQTEIVSVQEVNIGEDIS